MNFRDARLLTEWILNGGGLVINTLLIFMAFTEHNQTLKSYSRMIIVNAVVDYVYILGSIICFESVVLKNGSIVFVSEGIFSKLPIDSIHYWLLGVFVFIIAMINFIVPIEQFYRWYLIVRGQTLSIKKLVLIIWVACILALLNIIRFVFTFVRPEEETVGEFGHLLNNSMWLNPTTGQIPKFVANSFTNQRFFYQLIWIGIVAICSYLTAIVFGFKTYQKLKSMRHLMSQRTLRLQRNMTCILIIKAICPFCMCTLPVCMVFIGVVFKVNIPNLGFVLVMATSFIPMLSPLTTLILLHGYRRRLINQFTSLFSSKSQDHVHYIAGSSSIKKDYYAIQTKSVFHLVEGAHKNFGQIKK